MYGGETNPLRPPPPLTCPSTPREDTFNLLNTIPQLSFVVFGCLAREHDLLNCAPPPQTPAIIP